MADFEEDDIGADIAATMAEMAGEPAPEPAINAAPAGETETEKAERTRDEQGRFAKADETVQSVPTVQGPETTTLPPRSWNAAAKAKFATLEPDVQQEILRRETEIDAGKVQWETKAEKYNRLDAALSGVRDRYSLAGLSDEQYVGALVQADQMLRGPNALQAIHTLAQQYGINLSQMAPQQQQFGGPPQQFADPQIYSLQQTVQGLQSRLEAQDKAQETAAQQALESQIQAFASDPAHIYFDNVKPEMAALLQAGTVQTLADAYEAACHARPDIRQLIAAASVSKTAAPPTRPNGSSVTGARKGAQQPPPASNGNEVEDDVRQAVMEAYAGGV